jgi:UDP-N-acetylglucosamine acyltransferase
MAMIDPSARIHAMAVVEPGATIGAGCEVGPFAVIGPEVTLGAGVVVKSHAVVTGYTDVGEGTVIFPFACVGEIPQDLKFKGERTRLIVGARCRIREGATLNTGTEGGGGMTRVGDDCLLMTGAHVGHDAVLGNRVILANQAAIAGHCQLGAVTMVTNDVVPHGLVQGPRGELDGLNLVGLKRRGVERADIMALRAAYQMLAQGEGTFMDRARRLAEETDNARVREMTDFILGATDRSFLTPKGFK